MALKKRTPGDLARASGSGAGRSSTSSGQFPVRKPGDLGRTGGPPAGRAGTGTRTGPGRSPYTATPGELGRFGSSGPLAALKAKPFDENTPTGPEKIMTLRAGKMDENSISPDNSVVSYSKTVTGLGARPTMGVSNKKTMKKG